MEGLRDTVNTQRDNVPEEHVLASHKNVLFWERDIEVS